MERIIHYTSARAWEWVKKGRVLLPLSSPNTLKRDISDRVNELIAGKCFLVGISKPLDDGWVKYGLMDYLLKHTTGEVILGVPILEEEGAFVREHAPLSPKGLKRYGEDLWDRIMYGEITKKERKIYSRAYKKYIESTTSLKDYEDQFKVPEIWLPQETPVELIKKV